MGLEKSECIAIANGARKDELSPEALSVTVEVLKHGMEEMKTWADEGAFEDYLDLTIEGLLEEVAYNLAGAKDGVEGILEKAGLTAHGIEDLMTKEYLFINAEEFRGDGGKYSEIIVRAAEALGALARSAYKPLDAHIDRLSAPDYRDRLWAANAIVNLAPDRVMELLAPLADDPYCDGGGFYLVREVLERVKWLEEQEQED